MVDRTTDPRRGSDFLPNPKDADAWETVLTKALHDASEVGASKLKARASEPSAPEAPPPAPIDPERGQATAATEDPPVGPRTPLDRAIVLAVDSHAGHADLRGEAYILHAFAVLLKVGSDPILQQAAVLHDVLEHTRTTALALVRAGIHPAAIALVNTLTRTTDETYEAYIARVKAAGPAAIRIKVADLEHNLSRIPGVKDAGQRDELTKKYVPALAALKADFPKAATT